MLLARQRLSTAYFIFSTTSFIFDNTRTRLGAGTGDDQAADGPQVGRADDGIRRLPPGAAAGGLRSVLAERVKADHGKRDAADGRSSLLVITARAL
jgi:hypothetical protein